MKNRLMTITSIVIMLIAISAIVYSANILYKRQNNEIIKGSNDNLYEHAASYNQISTRIQGVENYFIGTNTSYFINNSMFVGRLAESGYGQIDIYKDNVSRGLIYAWDDGLAIGGRDSTGSGVTGILNLRGSQIQFNGTDVSEIGTQISDTSSSGTSVPNTTYTSIASVTLDPGTYFLVGSGNFTSNATGYRELRIDTTSTGDGAINNSFVATTPAVNGTRTYLNVVSQYKFSAQTTLYLKAYHNRGSALSVTGRFYALRLK